jgi:hypothetical protein
MAAVATTGKVNITSDVALASTADMTVLSVKGPIRAMVTAPVAGGTNYVAGEILNVTLSGSAGGQCNVKTVGALGAVTAIDITPVSEGANYTTGGTLATTGSVAGANCTVSIASVGSNPVTIHGVHLGLVANTGGVQCGKVDIFDGLSSWGTKIWTGYIKETVNAANQGVSKYFPLGITYSPLYSVVATYTAVTNATTASVAVVWSR